MQGIFAGRTQLRYPYGRYGYTRGGGKIWHGGMDLVGLDSTDIRMPYYKNKRITGKVVRILDFGAFVQLNNSQDGMVHVSELAPYRVEKPSDFVQVGDMVTVKIKEIDDQGRINLTMKNLPENEALWKDEKGKSNGESRPSSFRRPFAGGGNDRFPRRDNGPRRPRV